MKYSPRKKPRPICEQTKPKFSLYQSDSLSVDTIKNAKNLTLTLATAILPIVSTFKDWEHDVASAGVYEAEE